MLDFTQCDWIDLTKLTRYHQNLMTFLSDNYLNKSGGTMNGQINSCSILPKSPSSYTLGSSTNQWSNIYSNGFVLIDSTGQIRPNSTGTGNLGTSSYYWGNAYINNITSGTIIPKTDNTYDIGSSTYKFKDAYINNLHGTVDEVASTALSMPTGAILRLSAKGCTTASIAQENGVVDVSGNGHHTKASGNTSIVVDDKMGQCFNFDIGMIYGDNVSYGRNLTVSFWFKRTGESGAGYTTIFNTGDTENTYLAIRFASTGFLVQLNNNSNSSALISYISYPYPNVGELHHIAVSVDYTNKKLISQLDGVVSIRTISSAEPAFPETFSKYRIGGLSVYGNYCTRAKISDFRIYNYPLSETQMKSLYMFPDEALFAQLTADLIGTNVIKAKNLVKTEAVITETAQISQAIVKDLVVTNGVTIGDLNTTAQNANNKIDNLQVGGRNLLKNSDVYVYSKASPVAYYLFGDFKPENNQEVTFSFKGALGSNVVALALYNDNFTNNVAGIYGVDSNGIGKVTFKWKISGNNTRIIINQVGNGSTTGETTIEWVKLEYGNVATTYSPAPEDTDSLIATAQGKADSAYSNNQATQTQLDNLQVGGRNLVLGTSDSELTITNPVKDFNLSNYSKSNLVGNNIVSISFEAKASVSLWLDFYFIYPSGSAYASASPFYPAFNLTTSYQKYTASGNIGNPEAILEKLRLRQATTVHGSQESVGTVYIKNLKFEFGNQATTWTPAPEDVDADISTAQTTADTAVTNLNNINLMTTASVDALFNLTSATNALESVQTMDSDDITDILHDR